MTPVPLDIPLPLPADRLLLEALLVFAFLAHLLFVNLMLGGLLVALWAERRGWREPRWDALARAIAATVTVNKSMAVVLGVAPLLCINALYAVWFYSANALTGSVWILIVPLVTAAFLLAYLWKYSWTALARSRGLHFAIGAASAAILLFVPLIFETDVNLMLFPDRWGEVRGFLGALQLPNVLPRALHFLLASLAFTGFAGLLWFTRASFPLERDLPGFSRAELRRFFYGLGFGATLAQGLVGPLVLFTLPAAGQGWLMLGLLLLGVLAAALALGLTWRELLAPDARIGRSFLPILLLLGVTVGCMGYARHLYREHALAPHARLVAERSAAYRVAVAAAAQAGASGSAAAPAPDPGQELFESTCAACHALDAPLVGPPVTEIASIYAGNPEGIVAWVRAPGRKRPGSAPMPAFPLPEERLRAVAGWLLQAGAAAAAPLAAEPTAEPSP